jgi:anti-sigma-K factor RskA
LRQLAYELERNAVTCEEYKDLMPAYLLGTLDLEEIESLRAHLQTGCPRCAGALAEAEAALSPLPLALPPVMPPARIREQLLARIGARKVAPLVRRRTVLPWSIGIAASLVAVGLGVWAFQQQRTNTELQTNLTDLRGSLGYQQNKVEELQRVLQTQEDLIRRMKSRPIQVASLQGTPADTKATGRVFFDAKNSSIAIVAAGLAPLPESKTYELWLIPSGKNPIPVGTFSVDSQGNGFLETKVTQFAEATAAAVTAEPAGGSLAPTLPIRLAGKIETIP